MQIHVAKIYDEDDACIHVSYHMKSEGAHSALVRKIQTLVPGTTKYPKPGEPFTRGAPYDGWVSCNLNVTVEE